MRRTLKHVWTGTRWCLSCIFSFVLWSVWLALVLLLGVQAYIATHQELEVPGFLLRSLEERLAASGVRATFGRTSFDPTGSVLIEDARLSLPSFADPVITAHSIYVRLDPWALAVGRFNPRDLRISGASFAVPALLSPSGRSEEILRDLDATIIPHDRQIELPQLTARIAGITLVAHGAVDLPPRKAGPSTSLPVADFLSRNYASLSRQLVAFSQQLSALDQPSIQIELAPSESRGALASVTLFASSLKLDLPQPIQLSGLHAVTKLPLLGDAAINARLELTADSLSLPFGASAKNLRALVRGSLLPTRLQFTPHDVELSVDSLGAAGFSARSLSTRLVPGPLPQFSADVTAFIMDAPLAVHAEADLAAQTATLKFNGSISTTILTPVSEKIGVDVRKYFDFAFMDRAQGAVTLGPGWKFQKLSARLVLRGITAYHIIMENGFAEFEFDGRNFYASDTWAYIGENYARGTFEQDLKTLRYRFLLDGRLRPIDLSGWFHDWWPDFFKQLEFPVAPPPASVEVAGRWTEGRQSAIFVFADTPKTVIRGAALDRVRTRLFIRPGFYDGLEIFTTHPTGTAQGTFTYSNDNEASEWRTLDLNLTSSLDPAVAVKMLGSFGESIFSRFKWAAPPALKISGRIDGPAAPGGAHTTLNIDARTTGEFRFGDFPLENLVFSAVLRDDDLDLNKLEARFADGSLAGHAKVFGRDPDRRVNFDFTLKDASLGRVAATLQDFSARKKGVPPTPPGKFLQEKAAIRFELTAAAEGRYDDPLSYRGEGRASLQGAGLGDVRLLGLLSELFTFTQLHFNSATTHFKLDGAKVTFPDLTLRGSNSAIDAHGELAVDRRELDFKAKVFPFQESTGIIKTVVGAVLSPFSNIFEVKLSGTLDKPQWSLLVSPTNFLHSLAPGETPPAAAKPGDPASPPTIPADSPNPATPPATNGTPSPSTPSATPAPAAPPPAPIPETKPRASDSSPPPAANPQPKS